MRFCDKEAYIVFVFTIGTTYDDDGKINENDSYLFDEPIYEKVERYKNGNDSIFVTTKTENVGVILQFQQANNVCKNALTFSSGTRITIQRKFFSSVQIREGKML